MAYVCELGSGRKIYLDNQGTQTVITVASSGVGQQQQASISYQTGTWTTLPQLFQVPDGVAIQLTTDQGEHWLHLQGSSVSIMSGGFSPGASSQMQMQQVASMPTSVLQPMEPMQPMQPMQPTQLGDMQMNLKPMEMRMGNMEMRMGSATSGSATSGSATSGGTTPDKRRFCSQCGETVEPSDRFCSSCGHKLG
jgi:NADH pyrophosphatase NudC (nudix superfamily)